MSSHFDSTDAPRGLAASCSTGYLSRLPSPVLLPIVSSLEANPDFTIVWLVELNGYLPLAHWTNSEWFFVKKLGGASLKIEDVKKICVSRRNGIASPEEIDLAVTNALGHPMGAFRLMDFTGIDLWNTIRKLVTPKTSPHR